MEQTEHLTSSEDGVGAVTAAPPTTRRRGIWLVLAFLLTFIIGVGVTIWTLPRVERYWTGKAHGVAGAPLPLVTTGQPTALLNRPLGDDAAQMLDTRVVQLEERLNRITVEAQSASSNAARAEGLLVAFAARRALDSGTPLGYIEGQLRLRFGQAQPRAVATIINAAREPITLVDLRAGLLDVSNAVTVNPPGVSWWTALEHEARELVTIRKVSTPSPRPLAALDRALRYIEAGRVSSSLAEVEQMPGKAAADRWMQTARRYLEAHRALDLIETAAILEPRQLRASDGSIVARTSPLAP